MSLRVVMSLVLIVAVPAATTGCVTQCHTIGGFTSWVRLELPSPDWTVEQFCLDDTCAPPVGTREFLYVESTPTTYDLRLDVVDPAGSKFEIRARAETFEYRVNGKDCEPRTANATIVVAEDGSVSVRPLDAAHQ